MASGIPQLTTKTLTGEIDTLKSEIAELNLKTKGAWPGSAENLALLG